jgi:hypothetical protein
MRMGLINSGGDTMGEKPLWIVGMNFNVDEKEDEFNEWYNETHVPDVLKAPGVVSANRYVASGTSQGLSRYIAIYGFESEEAQKRR